MFSKRAILLCAAIAAAPSCASSTSPNADAASGKTVAGPIAVTGFRLMENGRTVIEPEKDGTFSADGPAKMQLTAGGELRRGSDVVLRLSHDGQITTGEGKVIGRIEGDRNLSVEPAIRVVLDADGKLAMTEKGVLQTEEEFKLEASTPEARRAGLFLSAWLFYSVPAPPRSADQPQSVP